MPAFNSSGNKRGLQSSGITTGVEQEASQREEICGNAQYDDQVHQFDGGRHDLESGHCYRKTNSTKNI